MIVLSCVLIYLFIGFVVVVIGCLVDGENSNDDDILPIVVIGWPLFVGALVLMGICYGISYSAKFTAKLIKSKV